MTEESRYLGEISGYIFAGWKEHFATKTAITSPILTQTLTKLILLNNFLLPWIYNIPTWRLDPKHWQHKNSEEFNQQV